MQVYKVTSTGMPIEATAEFMSETFPNDYTVMEDAVWTWLIDIGPFYDRFGSTKIAVLTSTDPILRAILQDLNIRKWVDLKRVDVAEALAYTGSVVGAVTNELITSILTTPLTINENAALRKLYFA